MGKKRRNLTESELRKLMLVRVAGERQVPKHACEGVSDFAEERAKGARRRKTRKTREKGW